MAAAVQAAMMVRYRCDLVRSPRSACSVCKESTDCKCDPTCEKRRQWPSIGSTDVSAPSLQNRVTPTGGELGDHHFSLKSVR